MSDKLVIPYGRQEITQQDIDSVVGVLTSDFLTQGPKVPEFERSLTNFSGAKHALAVNSATSALHIACLALGVEKGDLVWTTPITFVASANCALYCGADVDFVDIDSNTYNLSPLKLKEKLEYAKAHKLPLPKVVIPVHLCGQSCDMKVIAELSVEYGFSIIEDASHAHGATYKGSPIGSFGDISVFSLQGDKLAPAGEGGVFLTDSYEYWEKAVCMGDITRIIELDTPSQRFAATSFGIKTRIAPVSAAIGLEQLNQLDQNNKIRRDNLVRLSGALEHYGFDTFKDTTNRKRTYFEFLAKAPNHGLSKEVWIQALQAEGCVVEQPRYPLVHEQPFFTEGAFRSILRIEDSKVPSYLAGGFEQTRRLNQCMIKFPSFPNAADEILDAYIQAIHKVGRHQEKIKEVVE